MEAFFEKLKEKVNSDEYILLFKYLNDYKNGRIPTINLQKSLSGLCNRLGYLLRKHPAIFGEFFPVSKPSVGLTPSVESGHNSNKRKKKAETERGVEEINGSNNKKVRFSFNSVEKPNPESTPKNKTKEHLAPALRFSEKVRKETSFVEYLRLLKFLDDYGTGKITKVRLKRMVVDYFPDFVDDFIDVLNLYDGSSTLPPSEPEDQKQMISNNGKKMKKPDKGRSSFITPSYYKLLPDQNLPGVQSSGIDEVGKEVLNFSCFSKGSYDYSKVVRHRDPYEEMLNEKEDELFVNDMLKAWKESTVKNASELLQKIDNRQIERPINVNKHLTSYNFRYIQKMYGDEGFNIVDHLCHSPETVLPVIIRRLNEQL